MDAIITAGGVPQPDELLYSITNGMPKCMLEVHGKPMVQWVLDALGDAGVENVIVMGLPEDTTLSFPNTMKVVSTQGGIVDNIRAGAQALLSINPVHRPLMIISGDLPCVNAEMVNWVAAQAVAQPSDFQYSVVSRPVMESTFPGSRRTYIKLRGLEVCGGDVMVVASKSAIGHLPIIEKLVERRKNAAKQAAILGFGLLFLLVMGWLSLEKAEK